MSLKFTTAGCFIAKVLQCHIAQVEMYTLKQEVGGDKCFFILVIEHCSIVAYAHNARFVIEFETLGDAVYQTKLAQSGYFSFFF